MSIPTPEQLGVTAANGHESTMVDWTAVHDRLNQLGATCFRLERLPEGGCHITCLLPTSDPGRSHRIDAQGASDVDAARLFLTRAEQWGAGQ